MCQALIDTIELSGIVDNLHLSFAKLHACPWHLTQISEALKNECVRLCTNWAAISKQWWFFYK